MRDARVRIITATAVALLALTPASYGDSIYYLDFDPPAPGPIYPYSAGEKEIILDGLRMMYAAFPHMSFTLEEPAVPHSPVRFNTAAIGTSTGIDFRNIAAIDVASVNALLAFDFLGETSPTPPMVIKASINLAGHEIGHLEGLRHHDAFTPMGTGVPGSAVAAGFTPPYPGPTTAPLTYTEVQSLTLSLPAGFTLAQLTADLIVGQRSAVKLAFNHGPASNFWLESSLPGGPGGDDIASASPLPLKTIGVPNVTLPGDPIHGMFLFADVIAVKGATVSPFDSDYYAFFARAGDLVQIEVLSEIISSRLSEFNVAVAAYDPDEEDPDFPGIYYLTHTNGDERESSDALMLDLHITETKDYVIKVFAQFPGHPPDDFGEYELYVAAFRAEPPPDCEEPFADADGDGDVDVTDFGAFQRCFTGEVVPVLPEECRCFDIDHDRAIGATDFTEFSNCFTGPAILHATHPNPLCVEQP